MPDLPLFFLEYFDMFFLEFSYFCSIFDKAINSGGPYYN